MNRLANLLKSSRRGASHFSTGRLRTALPMMELIEPRLLMSTVTVTMVADTSNYPATVTIPQLNAHKVSLRDAITAANNTAGADTIQFSASVFDTLTLNTVLPAIKTNMSIVGPGSKTLTLNVNGKGSGFLVLAGVTAEIDGLNIVNGHGTLDQSVSMILGGGILNHGTLTLKFDSIGANSADEGGGIYSNGNLTIVKCNIAENNAKYGGGVLAEPSAATKTDTLNVYNSTFFANTATLAGGGIRAPFGVVTITDCTVTQNKSSTGEGGGIEVATSQSAILRGTISAGNTAPMGGVDIDGTFVGTHNLIGAIDAFGGLPGRPADHNLVGTTAAPINARLSNGETGGGPTDTLALLPGSPAIDAGAVFNGAPNTPINTDQRGLARPQGAAPDIGAYESFGFALTAANNSGKQWRLLNQPYADLTVRLTSLDPIATSFLEGVVVTFKKTAAANGATVALSATSDIVDGQGSASVGAIANGLPGAFTVTASVDGISKPVIFTLTNQVRPVFSLLSSPTIKSGTPSISLSGKLVAGIYIPSGVVTITVGTLKVTATIKADGTFAAHLAVSTLKAGSYAIKYAFAGAGVFAAATGTGTLKVLIAL